MNDKEDQQDEMLALSEMYDNEAFFYREQEDGHIAGRMKIKVHLGDKLNVTLRYSSDLLSSENSVESSFAISHLPPLDLQFVLPSDYPSQNPPNYRITCGWLTQDQITSLCSYLDSLWKDNQGCVTLFVWLQFLQDESLTFLHIEDTLDLTPLVQHAYDHKKQKLEREQLILLQQSQQRKNFRLIDDDTNEVITAKSDESNVDQSRDISHQEDAVTLQTMRPKVKKDEEDMDKEFARMEKERKKKSKEKKKASPPAGIGKSNPASSVLDGEKPTDFHSGIVRKWVEHRGFGFIECTHPKSDFFFHRTNLCWPFKVEQGLRVTFSISCPDKKGKTMAVNVNRVEPDALDDKLVDFVPDSSRTSRSVTSVTFKSEGKGSTKSQVNERSKQPVKQAEDQITPVAKKSEKIVHTSEPEPEPHFNTEFVPELANYLQDYNAKEEDKEYEQTLFSCYVCFSEKLGSQCIRFPECNHAYCKECMKSYFEVKISEGSVKSLTCPEEDCDKQALPTQVKDLVSPELYQRYESTLLETTLDTMTDILLCPLRHCQCPTVIDRSGNMGQCPKCTHVFCIYCKASYHGLEPCRMRSKEKLALVKEYQSASGERKALMEKRYGKKQLMSMLEFMLSESYLTDNTKACPNCRAPIQKTEGCNKMTCNRCSTHFCYLCGDRLPRENPYSHFSVLGSKCFNLLFEGADELDEEFNFYEDEDEDFEFGAFLVL